MEQYSIVDVSRERKDTNSWQLPLTNKEKIFTSYVYLDAASKRKINAYKIARRKRTLKQEKRKRTEEKLIRSFSTSRFGIYNWDKFYEEENENVDRYPISAIRSRTVLFQSNNVNQLLVVLNENEIAVFNNEEFKQLDISQIKSDKKYSFEMQRISGVNALEELKELN